MLHQPLQGTVTLFIHQLQWFIPTDILQATWAVACVVDVLPEGVVTGGIEGYNLTCLGKRNQISYFYP